MVFCQLSGSTHILDVVAGALIERLERGAAAEVELDTLLAAFLDLPNNGGVNAEVARILGQLDELGLVEPVT